MRRSGYTDVSTAETHDQALGLLSEMTHRECCLLIDANMPCGRPNDLLDRIETVDRQFIAVIMSGDFADAEAASHRQPDRSPISIAGALRKPFEIAEFDAVLEHTGDA